MTRRLLGAILVIILAWPATVVRAQGTQGMLADPISTPQLMDYADRLELSAAQRGAIEPLHDEYKEEFRRLRDGEIAEFMAEASSMGGMMPKREELEDFIGRMEKLQTKIKILDNRLFERFLSILTEDQITRLPRIRLLRDRQRFMTIAQQAGSMSGQTIVDVSEVVRDLHLSPEVLELADPTVQAYERRLTSDLEKLSETMFRMYLDMVDGIAAAGFEDMDFMDPDTDPEEMKRFQETMKQVWADLQSGIRERFRTIAKSERRAFASVAAVLPPGDATRFRTEYYSKAYPKLRFALPVDDVAWLVRAIDDERVPVATRDTMRPIVLEFLLRLDRLAEEGVALVDEQRENFNIFDPSSESSQDHWAKLRELAEQAGKAREAVNATLVDAVGAEELARVEKMIGAVASVGPDESVETSVVEEADVQTTSIDGFVAPRIARREARAIALELGLDDGEQAVLESLHSDYVAAYHRLDALEKLSTALQQQWSIDPETQKAIPAGAEKIDEIHMWRRKSIDAVRTTDDAFFGEVLLLVDDTQHPLVERLRVRRERAVYQREPGNAWGMGGDDTTSIDLSEFFREFAPSPEELARIESILIEYESESLPALRNQLETTLDVQRANEKWMAEVQRAQAAGETVDWREYQKVIGAGSSRAREASAVIVALNQRTLDAIAAQLSDETKHRVQRAYERRSHPSVYEDPQSVEEHLTKAMALEDLAPAQRAELEDLAASYRPAYESLSRRLVEFAMTTPDFSNWDAETQREFAKSQSETAKLTYDRNELSHRAARRIRTVLEESQLQMIGGLPQPPDGS